MIESYLKLFGPQSAEEPRYVAIPNLAEPRLILPILNRRVFTSALQIQNTAAPGNRLKKTILGASYPLPTLIFRSNMFSGTPLLRDLLGFISEKGGWKLPIALSGYCGSKGNNRKLTLQMMEENGKILGYVKIADNPEAARFVHAEANACSSIAALNLKLIEAPRSIFLDEWRGWTLYGQSNIGDGTASMGYDLTTGVADALIEVAKNSADRDGRENYLAALSQRVHDQSTLLGTKIVDMVNKSIAAARAIGFPLVFVHGDFVPYNVKRKGEKYAVFDWEFFLPKGLPFSDLFHYLYQGYHQIHDLPPGTIMREKIFGHRSNMHLIRKYAESLLIPDSAIPHFFRLYLAENFLFYIQHNLGTSSRENQFLSGLNWADLL